MNTEYREELFQKNIEELFIDLGNVISKDNLLKRQIRPTKKQAKKEQGRQWFEIRRVKFQKLVCDSDVIRKYGSNERSDLVVVAAAIADLISSQCVGVSPFIVAVLIVKIGLNKFCEDWWNNKKTHETDMV